MNPRVLIVIDNLDRAAYFGRFVDAFARNNIPVRFVPYRRSAHRELIARGCDSILLRPSKKPTTMDVNAECRLSLEVLSGDASLDTVHHVAPRLAASLQHLIGDFQPTHLFLWNGSQLIERLANSVCPPEIQKRFFEIANIPGKMFVDPKGVNAASSLYTSPEQLGSQSVGDDEFDQWRSGYVQHQRSRGVPQAKMALALQWERPFDALASKVGRGFYPIKLSRMIGRLKGKLTQTKSVTELAKRFAPPTLNGKAYRFFPLQVSGDTQLLLNSDVNNLQALDQVVDECQRDRIDLVIKIHPAENSRDALSDLAGKISAARELLPCYISTAPTPTLIQGAEKVYTINSTVGLESLILGKPLKVFGRAFFQHFVDHPQWLRAYILRYLVDIDYFGNHSVESATLNRCLGRWTDA